jgi:hypothetical protein
VTADLGALARPFAPVGLEEAQERAALTVRTDRKYVVDAQRFEQLVERLVDDHLALEVQGHRLCTYETVYFDTPDLLTFRQHVQGRRRRFKCRTRHYGGDSCFFEVKLRSGRGETLKRRLELPRLAHGVLVPGARAFLEEELARAYGCPVPEGLAPRLTTAFTRLTLVARDARERVTCDFGLAFRGGADTFSIAGGRVLVETKTALGNGRADRRLRRLGAHPVTPCSKYCLGVALARPGVRDNAFRPLLRRHFALPEPVVVEPPPLTLAGSL